MDFNQDQIAAVVGAQHLEIVGLRMQLAQALARIKELTPPETEPEKKLEAVK